MSDVLELLILLLSDVKVVTMIVVSLILSVEFHLWLYLPVHRAKLKVKQAEDNLAKLLLELEAKKE